MNANAFPAMDFVETDKAFELTADLPSMAEKDVSVEDSSHLPCLHCA
jgi:HSP20 family molecular chaperone IbpA